MSSAAWIDIDAILAEFTDQVRREELFEYRVSERVARHFLAWLELNELALEKVNAMVSSLCSTTASDSTRRQVPLYYVPGASVDLRRT